MSAYICNPEQFGVLAAYAVETRCALPFFQGASPVDIAQRIARELARANIASVAYCYPHDADGSRPGPCLRDPEIEEVAALYAAHFVVNPEQLTPIAIIKLCRGVDYQCCEVDTWLGSLAWHQLEWIASEAVSNLDGYENAHWAFDKKVPTIESFYDKAFNSQGE